MHKQAWKESEGMGKEHPDTLASVDNLALAS